MNDQDWEPPSYVTCGIFFIAGLTYLGAYVVGWWAVAPLFTSAVVAYGLKLAAKIVSLRDHHTRRAARFAGSAAYITLGAVCAWAYPVHAVALCVVTAAVTLSAGFWPMSSAMRRALDPHYAADPRNWKQSLADNIAEDAAGSFETLDDDEPRPRTDPYNLH